MKKITILGAGMVGRAMVLDLAPEYTLTVADINAETLNALKAEVKINTLVGDLSDKQFVLQAIADADLVIGAVPGFMGFNTLKIVIEAKKNIVDISFFNEDSFLLDNLAKENKVIAITDCGVAPGMSNIILSYHHAKEKLESFECYVGGLPIERHFPFEYKAPFSPIDVIEEYLRPARYVENGVMVTREALSDAEYLNFPEIGTLEAFNTDGLRSLIKTIGLPNMKEKTMRYPKHIEYIKVLRACGFFSHDIINVKGKDIRPIDVTSRLLFPMWKLNLNELEFTVMKVKLIRKDTSTVEYNLLDKTDLKSSISSMGRTTGFTATGAARLVLNNTFTDLGINPPEFVGKYETCFNFMMEHLAKRNIYYKKTEY